MRIYGVDFTSAPRRAKPITVAAGVLQGQIIAIQHVERLVSFADFEALLQREGPWVGGFDFPFSLPRELVRDLGWPQSWVALVQHARHHTRQEFRAILDAYRHTRPAGNRYAHRETDRPAGSSSPMKLVNPPVALMFHEGAPRLAAAGLHVPALRAGDPTRVALEAYPGLLARGQLGLRESYKSDTRSAQTRARLAVRERIVAALKEGRPLGIRLETPLEHLLVADDSGDSLDAAICAVQAAWAAGRPGYGLPPHVPAAEGWIVSA